MGINTHTTLGASNLYSTGVTILESKVEEIRPPILHFEFFWRLSYLCRRFKRFSTMQAYRTHAKVEKGQVIVQLPETFTGTEVEVIVLPSESAPAKPKSKKSMSKYRGVLKTGLSREVIDKQLQNLRDEWERSI